MTGSWASRAAASLEPWRLRAVRHWRRLLAGAALLLLVFGNQGFRSLVRNWTELRRLRRENATLSGEEQRLAGRLALMRAGDSALERMARKELGYVRKGEIEYRFPAPSPEAP